MTGKPPAAADVVASLAEGLLAEAILADPDVTASNWPRGLPVVSLKARS